mgnify:FL=1|jgi:zinc/manganese transport system substrate-binding protein
MEVRSFKALLGIGAVLLFSAFSSAGECRPLEVVASGTIIADIAKNIGGDKVSVRPLIGYGGEMHFYTEKPSDLKLVGKADLILKNCLDLDTWADRLAKASGTKAKSVCVTDGITPIRSQTGTDPHAWNSPYSALAYVDGTEKALAGAAPELAGEFAERAAAYRSEISALAEKYKGEFSRIPGSARKALTSHAAFGYLARDYGLDLRSIHGPGDEAEEGAGSVSEIIREVRKTGIKVIFIETMHDPRLANTIERETGAKAAGELYSDSLPDSSVSYLDYLRHNLSAVLDGLRSQISADGK